MISNIDDVREHLNLGCDDDTLLALKIETAESLVESYTGRPFADYYDDAEQAYSVPAPLLEAVRQITANLFENREGAPISTGTAELLAPFRQWSF